MAQVRTEIEIAATPEEVRAIILDFARYSEWHTSFIQLIAPTSPTKDPAALLPGEGLSTRINGVKLIPIVKANTSQEFSWRSSAYGGAFSGKHYFQFFESHITPGGTTFVHGEDWDGWMTWVFGEGLWGVGRKKVVKRFKEFASDVKTRSEDVKRLNEGIKKTQQAPYGKM